MKMRDENQVLLSGDIPAGFVFSHEEYDGRKMYIGDMIIFRKGNPIYDILPVIVSEEMYRKGTEHIVSVIGEMRSRRVWDGKRKTALNYIRATDVKYLEKPEENDANEVYLMGEIAFEPMPVEEYKKRKFSRIILNVKRSKSNETKFDSICCQFWDENAELAAGLKQGQKVKVSGRFQSYEKKGCDLQEQVYVYANRLEVI